MNFLSGLASAFLPEIKQTVGRIGGQILTTTGQALENKVRGTVQDRLGITLGERENINFRDMSVNLRKINQRINRLASFVSNALPNQSARASFMEQMEIEE